LSMLKKTALILSGLLLVQLASAQGLIHHHITATVTPATHSVAVSDEITIPAAQFRKHLTFVLNNDLKVAVKTAGVKLSLVQKNVKARDVGMDMEAPQVAARISQNKYALDWEQPPGKEVKVTLTYSGKLYYPVQQLSEEYARGFSTSPGIISEKGVYLAGSTDWVPWFNDQLFTFELSTRVPSGWDVVSQGKRTTRKVEGDQQLTVWNSPQPMEEVFLIAAPFHEYETMAGKVHVMAFLRSADESLANKYLQTTSQYLQMYRQLIGPYPFWKFALVENFWETGYGMPSFTLLGEKIIRFPFILHSSYPHELLHNWWGNSVYVDFSGGNWCEGLTVYNADQLIKEQRGRGAQYRRAALQRYTDYVNEQNDFPLGKFLSRHDAPTEAVGYGKGMMLWDMLRERMGDKSFIQTMQNFYRQFKFKRASFDDIRKTAEAVSKQDLKSFFDQWVKRKGAPQLELDFVSVVPHADDFDLQFTLKQIQSEPAFNLLIPVAVSFKDSIHLLKVEMNLKEQHYQLNFKDRPLAIQIDPAYDVFRRLDYREIPPALSLVFGSTKILIVLPSKEDSLKTRALKQLASTWARDKSKDIQIKPDTEVDTLPADRAVWLFGKENRFFPLVLHGLSGYDAAVGRDSIQLGKTTLQRKDHSFVITVRHPGNPKSALAWLSVHNIKAIPGLARKLPHYGKYSYLAFTGDEPSNVAKGQWPTIHSPLQKIIPFRDGTIPSNFVRTVPKRPALAQLAPVFSAQRMMKDIKFLSSDALKGRGLGSEGLEQAARYIVKQFKEAGLKPWKKDGDYFQPFEAVVDARGRKKTVKNIIGIIPGVNPKFAGQAVVVSAHYDHLGLGWPDVHKGDEGKIHHGADDNASGISVMLELARTMGKTAHPMRTIVFVAFTGEEAGLLGSRYFVQHNGRFLPKQIIADLNLDTVGRLNGKKILVLNGASAKEWPFLFMGVGYVTGVPYEMVTQQLDASDQVSFIRAGIPAVQIFSGPHLDYHRPTDTWDKIDPRGLVQVASFTKEALEYLAERKEPLTFLGEKQLRKSQPGGKKGTRRVSMGTVPDFGYHGTGVRIQSVVPGSPAAKAGLKGGDVITQYNQAKITDLRSFSQMLKGSKPGDEVSVVVKRGGKEKQVKVKLKAR